jgi:ATP synthase protein I
MNHAADQSEDASNPEFKPLTRQEAQALRELQPPVSPWRVVGWQVIVGLVAALAAYLVTGKNNLAASVLYGAAAVVIPAALFARGITSRVAGMNAGAAVFGFFLWEMVKIALTVAMLFAAGKVVTQLSWPAMLAGLVVTMKVYWVALMWRPGAKNVSKTEDKS